MENSVPSDASKHVTKMVLYGLATVSLYALMFVSEERILTLTAQGGWYFMIPITIAFIFSFAHGTFTAQFWDVLGIKAKK
ncbi:conserved hypothetical protein [Gammaproteobacteria bacterium]